MPVQSVPTAAAAAAAAARRYSKGPAVRRARMFGRVRYADGAGEEHRRRAATHEPEPPCAALRFDAARRDRMTLGATGELLFWGPVAPAYGSESWGLGPCGVPGRVPAWPVDGPPAAVRILLETDAPELTPAAPLWAGRALSYTLPAHTPGVHLMVPTMYTDVVGIDDGTVLGLVHCESLHRLELTLDSAPLLSVAVPAVPAATNGVRPRYTAAVRTTPTVVDLMAVWGPPGGGAARAFDVASAPTPPALRRTAEAFTVQLNSAYVDVHGVALTLPPDNAAAWRDAVLALDAAWG